MTLNLWFNLLTEVFQMMLFNTEILKEDVEFVSEVLKKGNIGYGPLVEEFENKFTSFSRKKYNVATNSASASAYMIFAYLKEKYGTCDVYTTSIGFISPAWSARHLGHNVIFVDVDDNLLFNINHYREIRKDNSRKIILMPVLYGGVSTIPGFDSIKRDGFDEIIVVDSAHCATPTINSDFTFFSFHPFKPIASSDGGMIATNDEESYHYFNLYRNFGRKPIDTTYDIVSDGFKFYMNNLNAAIALTQLKRYEEKLNVRTKCNEVIEGLNLNGRLLPHDLNSSYYFATLICDTNSVEQLYEEFPTSKHYPMIHKTSLFNHDCILPNTELLHKLILNLPLYDENIYHSRSRG